MPIADERLHRQDVVEGEIGRGRTGIHQRLPQDTGTHRPMRAGQGLDVEREYMVIGRIAYFHTFLHARLGKDLLGHCLERVGVIAQQPGASRQPTDHPRPKRLDERGQRLFAHPHPGESGVVVVGVEPGHEIAQAAGHETSVEVEQRATPQARPRCHRRERPSSGTPRESQQHGLRLIVTGVGEQHGRCPEAFRRISEGGTTGGAGHGLRASCSRSRCRVNANHLDRIEPEIEALGGRGLRDAIRPLLQAVVDNDRTRSSALLGQCRGQREGIWPPGACDEDERVGRQITQVRANSTANCQTRLIGLGAGRGRHRCQPRTRRTHASGSLISSSFGRAAGEVHTSLNPSIPALSITPRTNAAPSVY